MNYIKLAAHFPNRGIAKGSVELDVEIKIGVELRNFLQSSKVDNNPSRDSNVDLITGRSNWITSAPN